MKLTEVLQRPWLRVLAVVAALLLLPTIAWFAFPSAPLPAATSAASSTARPPRSPLEDEVEPVAPTTPGPASRPTEPGAPAAQLVTGTVVDGEGRPVDGAAVTCQDRPNLTATTDASGRFELPPDANGCKAIVTSLDHDPLPPVVIEAGKKNRLEVGSPGSIAGVVVDDVGHPVTEYTIAVEQFTTPDGERGSARGLREQVKDPLGNFELNNLSPGRYVLVATARGKPPTQSSAVEVESGRKSSGVRITLGKGATVSGTVTDRATKQPIAGVRVRLDGVTGAGGGGSTATDDQGHYSLDGVPSGAFSLRFTHPSYLERIEPLDARGQSSLRADVDLGDKSSGASSEWMGIGATLGQGGKYVEVAGVVEGGPAETAGMKAGDKIVEIEGRSAEGATVSDCVSKLRGPEGTRVDVTVERGGSKVELSITRARITR
ncbi:MAG: carboxypeptidase regulatory-like domain-containing protein [Myxococcales bacterium]|nr:carboxypeptidase regulatory-like domain-containing protein [Myxococcales bacterium]